MNTEELLRYIDPAGLTYLEWTQVGMALKHEGLDASVWDAWSQSDSRYKAGECFRKWETFNEETGSIVTGGTLYQMATDRGYDPGSDSLDWDSEIEWTPADGVVTRKGWVESLEVEEPKEWHPGAEARRYLEALFEVNEVVGYVTQARRDEDRDKWIPANKGVFTKTAGELLEDLSKYGDDIGAVFGDYNAGAGAWIRFNPLDGQGVRNVNVAEYRYALVESDSLEIGKQNQLIRDLELPVAVLVYSGGKSLHAIVRVDASSYQEYQKRVEYLYGVCRKNGLEIDEQNKNPSRLSRLPGCQRGNKKQFVIANNIGKSTFVEWKEYIESINDDLPEIDGLDGVWDSLPALAEPLIDGILRQGHKMLIAGPSKAGKSFLLIELTIAIAEGLQWLGRQCRQGRVLYVNLELDKASCLHRFKDVYEALKIQPAGIGNIDIWNLRGRAVPMNKLTPMLIRRAKKRGYAAVIIDPIYKVITGDENSAEQMSRFCGEFDKICTELGCSTIYCHHHSKGAQGGKKSADRASGSGVFARDPDAQIDMIELPLTEAHKKQATNIALCDLCKEWFVDKWEELSQDDQLNSRTLINILDNRLSEKENLRFHSEAVALEDKIKAMTAWRLEATLREFRNLQPIDTYFDYPVHKPDPDGVLKDITPENEMTQREKIIAKAKERNKTQKADKVNGFVTAFAGLVGDDGLVDSRELAEQMGVSSKTMLAWLGNGKRSIKDLRSDYEIVENEDPNAPRLIRLKEGKKGED